MTLDLGGGRRLVLAVGDDGWIWIAAGAFALVLLMLLSRLERRLVSRPVGLLLLALRMAAAVALVVALLEPITSRSWTERVEGRLIVGVDLSASMETTDSRRPRAESDRLRDAPGLAPPAADDAIPTRLATASRILDGSAMEDLSESFAVELFGFARSTDPMDRETLIDLLKRGASPDDDPDNLLATDWGPVLDRALAADGSAPVLGVVLLTDGLRNAPPPGSGPGGNALADRLASAGVPVFPVLIGSTIPPRDAAIAAIRAPASSFEGDAAAVFVEVKADGFDPGEEIPIVLEGEGIGPLHEVVTAGPDGSRAVASFRVPMERAGTIELLARVEPPGDPDEFPENDERSVAIRVGDEPSRVLLIDAEARWEFRYLRAALDRDRRVDLLPVLLAPPPASGASGATFSAELPPAPEPGPDSIDPFLDFDVIILGDVPPELLPEGVWGRLDAFVSEGGGTLVIAAGPRSWPGSFDGNETARALLPVLDPEPVAFDRSAIDPNRPALPAGVAALPDLEAGSSPEEWPMLQFATDPEASRLAWRGLAPLSWALSGRAKPGATALLVADPPNATTGANPIAAAHPYGLGKVLWVGTDGTWRWRLRAGDAYHHRFWGQVIRWASEETASRGNRLVRFGPDRPRNPSGSPVPLFARFSADLPGLGRDLTAAARISPIDDPDAAPLALVPLHPAAARPGTFEAIVPPLPPGRYLATLDAPSLADSFAAEGLSPPEADFEVAPEPTTELLALTADPGFLDPLAAATGGQLLRDFDAGQLPDLLRSQALEQTRTSESPLWDTPAALIAFFTLLTAEWLIRKRAGLP